MQLLVKYVQHISVYEVVFFRSFISLVISFSFLKCNHIPILGNNKKWLIARGFFGIIALILLFDTLQNVPLASAVSLQYLSPLFASIFAIFFLNESMSKGQYFFVILCLFGVFMVKGAANMPKQYLIVGLSAACFSGMAYNCVRMLSKTEHPMVVVFYFPLIGTPIVGILSFFQWTMPKGIDWFYLISIGILTQVAQYYMTKALQSEQIASVLNLKYLGVVYAILFGYIFFGETYSYKAIIGMLCIILGVLLNTLYKKRRV